MNAALLGDAATAKAQTVGRAKTASGKGYRFQGFAPHEQDYEPSADQFANMNVGGTSCYDAVPLNVFFWFYLYFMAPILFDLVRVSSSVVSRPVNPAAILPWLPADNDQHPLSNPVLFFHSHIVQSALNWMLLQPADDGAAGSSIAFGAW